MSRVALASIPALTFYKDELTAARRGDPIPQLTCIGKACRFYTPDVVRCTNSGGSGTDVDWKCEAELPEALRFGRVQVSCEGWSGQGDPYVLKESCGLEYRLVEVPGALRSDRDGTRMPSRLAQSFTADNIASTVFMILWLAFLVLILYNILKNCLRRPGTTGPSTPRAPGWGGGWGGGGTNSWFNSGPHDPSDPPPPYSKSPQQPSSADSTWGGYRPGFWTGAALGALGTGLYNRMRDPGDRPRAQAYDWERERTAPPGVFGGSRYSTPGFAGVRRPNSNYDDRGEGSSSGLGSMRRSTGYGGSSVR